MRLKNWYGVCAIILIVAMLGTPVLSSLVMAQESEAIIVKAAQDGERDAEAEVNKGIWFIAGCLGGVPGLIVSYVYTPTPPSARLIGKSPEYVAAYSDAYIRKAKKIQTDMALTGCGVAAASYAAYYLFLIMFGCII
ncbi:MAG: hypothetical protein QME40_02075 [bacterium]|nr:hypothetical protein [bacterium]